jgi:O-antigen/teichoic acid export membrane protein
LSLARQSRWLLADRLVMVGSMFVTGVIVARGYGPVVYGSYLIASSVIQTIIGAVGSGADVPFVRAFVAASDAAMRTAVVRRFARGLLIAALVAMVVPVLAAVLVGAGAFGNEAGSSTSGALSGLLLAGIAALPQLPLLLGEWRLRAAGRADRIATLRVPLVVAGLSVRMALVAADVPLWMLVVAIGLEASLVALAMWWRWDDAFEGPASGPRRDIGRGPLAEAFRQGAASLLVVTFFRINPLIVGAVSGVSETARYGAALSLVLAFDLLTSSVSAAAFPRLVRHGAEPQDSLPALLEIGRTYAALAAGFFVATVLAGGPLLALIYGEPYRDAYPVLLVLAATTLFTSSAAVRGLYINLTGCSELHLMNAAFGLAVLVPCSLWLSASHGALGAAVAMVVASAASGLAASFVFATTRPVGIVQLKSFVPRWIGVR